MNYAWVITEDCVFDAGDSYSCEGTIGPRNTELTAEQIKEHPMARVFRLRDGDDEVMAVGFLVDLTGECSGFEPLDDFGTPSLGATEIQYKEAGVWKTI